MAELKRNQKVVELEQLAKLRERFPKARIVLCHGVFDILHGGHLAHFESAKRFGDILVVSVTSDKLVNKGPGRPYFNSIVRARMVAAMEAVDYVVVSPYPTAVPIIEMLRPAFYVKGPDYRDMARDPSGAIYEEEAVVKSFGGKLVFTDDEAYSSSTLINKFFAPWNEDQQGAIEHVQKKGGIDLIEQALTKLSKMRVAVMGEPIIDTYIFCHPENISSKSPSISAKFVSEENYAGGSLAIANHIANFVREVNLYFTHGGEPVFLDLLKEKMAPNVNIQAVKLDNVPTPRKTRFIEAYKQQRIFEITHLASDQWFHHSNAEFCKLIKQGNTKSDVTVIADFGHGLFEREVLDTVAAFKGFVSLNVQTNSSNFGFNPFTKHKRFSFLNIDTREARIAYHDRFTPPMELAKRAHQDMKKFGASFAMTTGPNGAYYFPKNAKQHFHAPAFSDTVVDATGAGDAFFSLASLLVGAGCPDHIIPFVANVFAGLKTKIIGNKTSVSRAQLVKAVNAILK